MSIQQQKAAGKAKADFSQEKIEEYRETFNEFDKDGNGSISAEELEMAMKAILGNDADINARELIAAVDKDGNGEIDFDEFLSLMAQYQDSSEQDGELLEAFKVFDKDGNGKISTHELRTVMTSLGETLTEGEADEMIREADVDGDGQINYDEFVRMMKTK